MIVYCCQDLLFATKIRTTAEAIDIPCRPARDEQALQNRLDQVEDGKLNEAVTGVVVDLALEDTATALIRLAAAHDSRPQIAAFGSHVDTDMLQSASENGAHFVMPRSSFTANLPEILQRLADQPSGNSMT